MNDWKKPFVDLDTLVDMADPGAVLDEILHVGSLMYPGESLGSVRDVYEDVVRLYGGEYPGYRACTTEYHDLKHTTDTALALVRVLHGCAIDGLSVPLEICERALVAALLHDTGYIQSVDDVEGTGGKYTRVHVGRSKAFASKYLTSRGGGPEEISSCLRLIESTDLNRSVLKIGFGSEAEALAGRAIFAADLVGQMGDRTYLEKLLFLFEEFSSASIVEFSSEDDLLAKTMRFYETVLGRIEAETGGVAARARSHFRERWGIDADLYLEAIGKNVLYLEYVIENSRGSVRDMLHRGGLVKRLGLGGSATQG